ncbi:MAG TPA: antitoxin VapB family protein [Candidatus Thermoplasmatota archaeon]|nr:antitoxin VapB family protein [Candidatus Thermoplasmatota archaeon]
MVKPVSLSDPAFAALREEKRPGESDSDVVLRLIREAKARRKDPLKWLRHREKPATAWEDHERFLEKMRKADRDRPDPWQDA